MIENDNSFVLASGSEIRRRLLAAAGIRFEVDPARVDESRFKDPDPAKLALVLARAKAEEVAGRRPGRYVLGADQVFTYQGRHHPKPENPEALRRKLLMLNGGTHDFHCGMVIVRDGELVHESVSRASVTFHALEPREIEAYVRTGEGIGCAGGYRLEEGGVRLVSSIEGNHFTVLGLPMLRLVGVLRELGWAGQIYEDRNQGP